MRPSLSLSSLALPLGFLALSAPAAASPLRVGITSPLSSFDCQQIRDVASIKAVANVYDTLVAIVPQSTRLEAGLATTWTPSNRFSTWTFRIRPNVVFSDGSPANPVVIAESLKSVPELANRGEILGDDGAGTVTFRLKAADGEFPAQLAQIFTGVSVQRGGKLVGTGPFQFGAGSTLAAPRLVRNPRYWGTPPKVEEVVFKVYSGGDGSAEKLRKALETDEIDLTDMLPPWEAKKAAENGAIATGSVGSRGLTMLAFNTKKGPMSDVRFRRAVATALDRATIVRNFFPSEQPARAPVPPTIHPLPKDPYDRDVEAAKRLLAEVKLPKNWEPVILDAFTLGTGRERMGDFVARDLALLGIKAKVVVVPTTGEFLDRMSKGKFDLAIGRWIADTGSVADFLASNLATDQQGTCPSCNNVYGYSEPEIDRLLAELRATRSSTALLRINEIFGRDVPYVPIAIGPEVAAWNRRVTGFGPSPTPFLYLRNVGFGEKAAAQRTNGSIAAGGR